MFSIMPFTTLRPRKIQHMRPCAFNAILANAPIKSSCLTIPAVRVSYKHGRETSPPLTQRIELQRVDSFHILDRTIKPCPFVYLSGPFPWLRRCSMKFFGQTMNHGTVVVTLSSMGLGQIPKRTTTLVQY